MITAITTFDDSQDGWESIMDKSPVACLFLSPQWQQIWWRIFGEGREMSGFRLASNSGETKGIASLCKRGSCLSFVGSPDTFDYNDFLVRPGDEEAFYSVVLDVLDDGEWTELHLDSLIEHSPTLACFPELARRRGYSVELAFEDVTSGVALPGDWDRYLLLLSKKDRHELRRKLRRLDTQTEWRWFCVSDPDEVEERFDDFLHLMRISSPEKREFMTPERETFFRSLAARMSELDSLRLFFMEMNGALAATSLCFDYRQARLLYNSGYDPSLSYYSVGLLLHAMCVKDAIERGIGYFDFLRGPEPYKAHLGGTQKSLYKMVVKRV